MSRLCVPHALRRTASTRTLSLDSLSLSLSAASHSLHPYPTNASAVSVFMWLCSRWDGVLPPPTPFRRRAASTHSLYQRLNLWTRWDDVWQVFDRGAAQSMATELLKAYVHNEAAIVAPAAGAHTLASAAGIGLTPPLSPLLPPPFGSLIASAHWCLCGWHPLCR